MHVSPLLLPSTSYPLPSSSASPLLIHLLLFLPLSVRLSTSIHQLHTFRLLLEEKR